MSLAADIVIGQRTRYERLWGALTRRQRALADSAIKDIEKQLAAAERGSWSAAMSAATLVQLAEATRGLSEVQLRLLRRALPGIAKIAQTDVAAYLTRLDRHFAGVARPLRWDSLEWLEGYSRPLLNSRLRVYQQSFARYGAEAVAGIESAVAKQMLLGMPWTDARKEVMSIVREQVGGRQWMVDRIIRTETSSVYASTTMAALLEEDEPDDPMLKKLVAYFDGVTGYDSKVLHGQTRRVQELFSDVVNGKMFDAPPNRPNDREIVVGWRASWGDDAGFDRETRDPEMSTGVDATGPDDLDVGAAADEAAAAITSERARERMRLWHERNPEPANKDSSAWDRWYDKKRIEEELPNKQARDAEAAARIALSDRHDAEAGGRGVPFATPDRAIAALEQRGIDVTGLRGNAGPWAQVMEAEMREFERNPWAAQITRIGTDDMGDSSAASLTFNKADQIEGARARLSMNIQAHKFEQVAIGYRNDMQDLRSRQIPWTAAVHISEAEKRLLIAKYRGIMDEELIVPFVHNMRHELAHGIEFNLSRQTDYGFDVEARRLYDEWIAVRRTVNRNTWGADSKPLVSFTPVYYDGSLVDTWHVTSVYANTDDYERFAESVALGISGAWDRIPTSVRPIIREILGLSAVD